MKTQAEFVPSDKLAKLINKMNTLQLAKDKVHYLKTNWKKGFNDEIGHLSQANVARLIGVSFQTVNKHWLYEPTIKNNPTESILDEPLQVRKVSYSFEKIDNLKAFVLRYEQKLEQLELLKSEIAEMENTIGLILK